MVPWSIYILTFLYNFTFGALVGESPRAGAINRGPWADFHICLFVVDFWDFFVGDLCIFVFIEDFQM